MLDDDYIYYAVTVLAYNVHTGEVVIGTTCGRSPKNNVSKYDREESLRQSLLKHAKKDFPEQHFYGHKVLICEIPEEGFQDL